MARIFTSYIGNYINIRTQPYDNFDDYILTDDAVMHEYGHTFDSRIWDPLYLPVRGLPSIVSANNSKPYNENGYDTSTHRIKPWERSANRKAKKYFRKHGVIWNEPVYPTYK